MLVRYFLLWLPMIVIAFINATIRELFFVRRFNEMRSHQLSTVTLMLFSSLYIFFILSFLNIQNSEQALIIGLLWVVWTVIFEFTLGRITKKPWRVLLNNYNITLGHLWPLFLFCLLFLPYLCYLLKK